MIFTLLQPGDVILPGDYWLRPTDNIWIETCKVFWCRRVSKGEFFKRPNKTPSTFIRLFPLNVDLI